jgi:hypothetical protein
MRQIIPLVLIKLRGQEDGDETGLVNMPTLILPYDNQRIAVANQPKSPVNGDLNTNLDERVHAHQPGCKYIDGELGSAT